VVLEKDGDYGCADHVKHEKVLQCQGGKEYSTYNERANWSAHILCRNCLLKLKERCKDEDVSSY
jgi:acetone carboxylase gamma subunit